MTLFSNYWCGYCVGLTPASSESIVRCGYSGIKPDSPLSQIKRLTTKRDIDISSGIVGLLNLSSPFTVTRAIPFIIVNALNAVLAGRFFTHISKKHIKRIAPTLAERNAATTVIGIPFMSWIAASSLHVRPSVIFRRIRFAVGNERRKSFFTIQAPARFRLPRRERIGLTRSFATTYTSAVPSSLSSLRVFGTRNNSESGKSLTGKVFEVVSCHNILRRYSSELRCGKLLGRKSFGFEYLATGAIIP